MHTNWFKFTPADWMMGKIQRCSPEARDAYVRLWCFYWNKHCKMTIADTVAEIGQPFFDELTSRKVVEISGDEIVIKFLAIQYKELIEKAEDPKAEEKSGEKKKTTRKSKPKEALTLAEQSFLIRFNELKLQIRGSDKGQQRTLSEYARTNFKKIQASEYSQEEIDHAITAMLLSKWPKETGNDTPDHLLVEKNFIRYRNIESIKQAQSDGTIKATREDKWNSRANEIKQQLSGSDHSGDFNSADDQGGSIGEISAEDQDIWKELQS